MPATQSQRVNVKVNLYDHCISRCARRAFLCSEDRGSGKTFDRRKGRLVERM
jgi:hypothetical protein